jgi:LysR family hydrogen peroxide-inducible transcriptional activator
MLTRLNYSLTQLEYVLAVNKHGHFSKAALACHVSQPTLSMQLQKLENDLGVVIFDRSKKPVILTDIGRQLIEQIQKIIFEARKMNQMIKTSQERGLEGQLIVGVIPTIAPYLLPLMLPVVEKLYSGLRLKILELQTHQIIDSLNEDELDVGILAIPIEIPGIIEESLYFESFSILCHKGHELSTYKKVKSSNLTGEGPLAARRRSLPTSPGFRCLFAAGKRKFKEEI